MSAYVCLRPRLCLVTAHADSAVFPSHARANVKNSVSQSLIVPGERPR